MCASRVLAVEEWVSRPKGAMDLTSKPKIAKVLLVMLSAASKPVWRRIVSQGQGSGRFLFTPAVTRRPYAAVAARRVKGGSRVQKSALRRVWEAVSPRARPELIFNSYTRHPGATGTLLCLVGANVAVYVGWYHYNRVHAHIHACTQCSL